jgi:hypothetical protein
MIPRLPTGLTLLQIREWYTRCGGERKVILTFMGEIEGIQNEKGPLRKDLDAAVWRTHLIY